MCPSTEAAQQWRRPAPPVKYSGTERLRDQSRGPYVRDDVIKCPVNDVADTLNVLLGHALQPHAEVGVPGVAIVPATQEGSRQRACVACVPRSPRTSFKGQTPHNDAENVNSHVLQDKPVSSGAGSQTHWPHS